MKILNSAILLVCAYVCVCACAKEGAIRGTSTTVPITANVRAKATKVQAITTSSLEESPYGSFKMDAWADADYTDERGETHTERHFVSSNTVNYNSSAAGTYKWEIGTECFWINAVGIHFWCYAPTTINGTRTITSQTSGGSTMTFNYVLPAGGHTDTSTGDPDDATRQDDLLFSHNYEKRTFDGAGNITSKVGTRSDNRIDIEFEHALSQVNFAICVTDGSFNLDLVDNILVLSFDNVASSASCTFNGAGAEGSRFIWGSPAGTSTFTQAYTLTDLGYYGENASGSRTIKGVPTSFPDLDTMRSNQQSFMMIPHTLDEYATISATFEYTDTDGRTQSTTRTVNLSGEEWLPGKYYTYRINASTIGRDIHMDVSLIDWGSSNESMIP